LGFVERNLYQWQFSISLADQTNFLPCGPQAVVGPVVSSCRSCLFHSL